jgi:hypothetical protein
VLDGPAGISAEMGAEEHEEGTDAFAAAVQDVGGYGVDESDAGVEIFPDLFLDPLEFFAIHIPHIGHAVEREGGRSVRHGADSRAGKSTKSSSCRCVSRVDRVVVLLTVSSPIQ